MADKQDKTVYSASEIEDQMADTIGYMDSASQVGRHSRSESITSALSNASSSRLRAAAERAALEAEAAAERKRQGLEQEELKLRQKRRQIELETQIAKVTAMEKTYAEAEELEAQTSPPVQHSTPYSQPFASRPTMPGQDTVGETNGDIRPTSNLPPHVTECSQVGDILTQMLNNSQLQQQSLVESLQLPKTELMTFDGDPAKYWLFIRAFENAVGETSVSDAAKLARLQQYCTGPARKLIQCCVVKPPSEGYTLAKKLLKDRFGNEYITEAWVSRIVDRPDIRDSKHLLDFADDLRNCKVTLETMGKLGELNNSKAFAQIVGKLPYDLRKAWLKRVHHIKHVIGRPPTIEDITNFVTTSAEQANDPVFGKLVGKEHTEKFRKETARKDKPKQKQGTNFSVQIESTSPPTPTSRSSYAASTPAPLGTISKDRPARLCPYCNQSHGLFGCDGWKAPRVTDRLNFVQSKRLCVNCLQQGHQAKDCTRNTVCTVPGCGRKHTKFLHLPRSTNMPPPTDANHGPAVNVIAHADSHEPTTTAQANVTCSSTGAGKGKVALPIVPVKVRGHTAADSFLTTYALLDSGSTQTFCSESLMTKLGVPGKHDKLRLTTPGSCDTLTDTYVVSLEVTDINDNNVVALTNVLTRPELNITSDCLMTQEELNKWPHLKDIVLPDGDTKEVHLLIGQDNPSVMTPKEVREAGSGAPYATRTILGWTLNGPVVSGPQKHVSSHYVDIDTNLLRQVEKFWKLEDIGGSQTAMSISDRKAVAMWEQSVCQVDGHYSMDIPFKTKPPHLPDNKVVAEHRLRLLGKRLGRDSDMKEKYIAGMSDLLAKGYAEEVPPQLDRTDGAVWYLPHHPVIHPCKPGKLRIVFDCAARYQGVSLNDRVHQGPDLTSKLVGVLLRFHQETIALMADIEGMFLQVRVNEPDRDVLRFLWWDSDNITKASKVYRMTRHLFGGVWSPSCANFALKRTASDNILHFDAQTIDTIDKDFYVDDCLKSVATESEAINLVGQLREALALGGFHLTKWISNSREVLRSVPEAERAKDVPSLDFDDEILPAERALGVLWEVESDTFTFDIHQKDKPLTRRGLLSTVSSVYDPLGFAAPFVLTAKVLFQQLCRSKNGWDDPIPEDIEEQWVRWMSDLPDLRKLSIPRCVKPVNFGTIASAQLHHFSDASERGYGATTYLRLQDTSGQTHCTLLMAKAKLAPLKSTTIPHLELSAAVVSVKLDEMMCQHLSIPLCESIYWSDSMIVLQYLRNEDKRYQTFVANRVARILEHSTPQQWRHIDSDSNPGDDVSRGLTAQRLVDSERWLSGPRFLLQSEDAWPSQPDFAKMVLPKDMELKPTSQVYKVETSDDRKDVVDTLLDHYSSWSRLKRAVAWILRVKAVLHGKIQKTQVSIVFPHTLTVHEILVAEKEIVMHVQKTSFDDTLLKSGGYRKLSPTKSRDGILQVGGRLDNAALPEDAKHPWMLPARHPLTTLIVRHYHGLTGHSGSERTLAEVRQRYWIVRGRAAVKSIIHTCIPCRKRKAPTVTQRMADLPKDRVTPGLPPFSMVGVDFFGPFMVKRARSELKRYGCLFTCLATRAIHLEVCHSLETDSFLNALQRFISRRGKPVEIRSDNGTNLVGGMRELRQAIQEWNRGKIDKFLSQRGIQWIFNPPAASHFGGVWERQIRTVRAVLNSLLNQQTLDDEGLQTLMCVVEGIVNGRPITKLSDDPRDPMPLTPYHLLLPPGNFVKQDIYKRRWRQVQYLADLFWRRWLSEYLPSLQERQKWLNPQRNIRSGDLVLVRYDNTPRNHWPLGLVLDTYPGMDGHVRSVQVKMQSGVYDRPVDKLCLLEGEEMGLETATP